MHWKDEGIPAIMPFASSSCKRLVEISVPSMPFGLLRFHPECDVGKTVDVKRWRPSSLGLFTDLFDRQLGKAVLANCLQIL